MPSASESSTSSAPLPRVGLVRARRVSAPSAELPSSVSVSRGSVVPMPVRGPVPFTSSPSLKPSPSVSRFVASVSPAPFVFVAPITGLSDEPFLLASSNPSARPSPSVSGFKGSVFTAGSASAMNGPTVPTAGPGAVRVCHPHCHAGLDAVDKAVPVGVGNGRVGLSWTPCCHWRWRPRCHPQGHRCRYRRPLGWCHRDQRWHRRRFRRCR